MLYRTFVAAAFAAGIAALSSGAYAVEMTGGTVTARDDDGGTITLDDGETYVLPTEMELSAIAVGSDIYFSYEEDGTRKVIRDIDPGTLGSGDGEEDVESGDAG